MQLVQLFFPFGFFRLDFTGKNARSRLLELLYPSMNLRLVNAELNSAIVFSPVTGKSQQGYFGLKGRGVVFTFAHAYSPSFWCSLYTCPNFGEYL